MNVEKEIAEIKHFYDLAVKEDADATYHLPVLKVWPLIIELLVRDLV